jgi:hypothetical protein
MTVKKPEMYVLFQESTLQKQPEVTEILRSFVYFNPSSVVSNKHLES